MRLFWLTNHEGFSPLNEAEHLRLCAHAYLDSAMHKP